MKINRKSQVVLETALVLVALVIFMVGIIRVWAWFVNTYTGRWNSYNRSRTSAAQSSGFVPDGYDKVTNRLNLFQ